MSKKGKEIWIVGKSTRFTKIEDGMEKGTEEVYEDDVSYNTYLPVRCKTCGEYVALLVEKGLDRHWTGIDPKTGLMTGGQEYLWEASGICPTCGSQMKAVALFGERFVPNINDDLSTIVYDVKVTPEKGCEVINSPFRFEDLKIAHSIADTESDEKPVKEDDPPWYKELERMKERARYVNDETNPYKLVGINENGTGFVLDSYPTKIEARDALLLYMEALWLEGRENCSARVIDSEGHIVYDGTKFLPDEDEYDINGAAEIWMGIKSWLGEKNGKKYVLITALDRLIPIPMDYELLKEKKDVTVIFRKVGDNVEFKIVEEDSWDDSIKHAREFVNENKEPWDEIIVMSDLGSVYEVITRVEEETGKVNWKEMEKLRTDDGGLGENNEMCFKKLYIKLSNGVRLRQYKETYCEK